MNPALRSSLIVLVRIPGWRANDNVNGAHREPGQTIASLIPLVEQIAAMSNIG